MPDTDQNQGAPLPLLPSRSHHPGTAATFQASPAPSQAPLRDAGGKVGSQSSLGSSLALCSWQHIVALQPSQHRLNFTALQNPRHDNLAIVPDPSSPPGMCTAFPWSLRAMVTSASKSPSSNPSCRSQLYRLRQEHLPTGCCQNPQVPSNTRGWVLGAHAQGEQAGLEKGTSNPGSGEAGAGGPGPKAAASIRAEVSSRGPGTSC